MKVLILETRKAVSMCVILLPRLAYSGKGSGMSICTGPHNVEANFNCFKVQFLQQNAAMQSTDVTTLIVSVKLETVLH